MPTSTLRLSLLALSTLSLATAVHAANTPKIKYIRVSQGANNNYQASVEVGTFPGTLDVAGVEVSAPGTSTAGLTATPRWIALGGPLRGGALPAPGGQLQLVVTLPSGATLVSTAIGDADGLYVPSEFVQQNNCPSRVGCVLVDAASAPVSQTPYSNHAWGSALDFSVAGVSDPRGLTAQMFYTAPLDAEWCSIRDCTPVTEALTTTIVADGTTWTGTVPADWDGAAALTADALNDRGQRLDRMIAEPGPSWEDGAFDLASVALRQDSLTTVTTVARRGSQTPPTCDESVGWHGLVLSSDGWDRDATLPGSFELSLDGGGVHTVPVGAYQIAGATTVDLAFDPNASAVFVEVDGQVRATPFRVPCDITAERGICLFAEQAEDGGWEIGFTQIQSDPSLLEDGPIEVRLWPGDAAPTEIITIEADPEVHASAMFGSCGTEEWAGTTVAGQIRTFAGVAADGPVLGVGQFAGVVQRGPWGSGGLAGTTVGGGATTTIDFSAATAVEFEEVGEDLWWSSILRSNASGTRNIATATSTKPGLL